MRSMVVFPVVQMRDTNGNVLFERVCDGVSINSKDTIALTWNVKLNEQGELYEEK
jgi:hypothetical protein